MCENVDYNECNAQRSVWRLNSQAAFTPTHAGQHPDGSSGATTTQASLAKKNRIHVFLNRCINAKRDHIQATLLLPNFPAHRRKVIPVVAYNFLKVYPADRTPLHEVAYANRLNSGNNRRIRSVPLPFIPRLWLLQVIPGSCRRWRPFLRSPKCFVLFYVADRVSALTAFTCVRQAQQFSTSKPT